MTPGVIDDLIQLLGYLVPSGADARPLWRLAASGPVLPEGTIGFRLPAAASWLIYKVIS